jgi:hypothetical protein
MIRIIKSLAEWADNVRPQQIGERYMRVCKHSLILSSIIFSSSIALASGPSEMPEPVEGTSTPPPLATTSTNSDSLREQLKEGDSNRDSLTSQTVQIKAAIEKDDSVSSYADKIEIIPQGKVIVLKGPVISSFEKLAIEKAAIDAVGQDNIRSELVVVK